MSQPTDAQLKELALQKLEKSKSVPKVDFPTEIIELPSKGKFYPEGHPLSSGTIEMKYMTAKEEDILTTSSYIKQGIVLDKLFESLIVTPVNYEDILLGDKNAIMIAARVLGYGKEYEVTVTDPSDPEGAPVKYTIDLTTIDAKPYDFDNTLIDETQQKFTIILPVSKAAVELQLITVGLERKIKAALASLKKTPGQVDRELTTRLKYLIHSVNGDTSRAYIDKFVDNMLVQDSRYVRQMLKEYTPDIDLKFTFISPTNPDADPVVMEVPMDVTFFWPKS